MKRSFYRRQVPPSRQVAVEEKKSSLEELRLRIMNVMLYGAVTVGLIAVISNLMTDIPQGNWGVIAVYAVAYAGLLAVTFFRRLPFDVRAYGLTLLPYLLGVTAAVQDGIAGNGRVWMLLSAGLASILLGPRVGVGYLLLGTATLLGIGGAFSQGWLPLPDEALIPSAAHFSDWLGTGSVFLLTAFTIGVSLSVLIRGLDTSLQKEQALASSLAFDQQQLDDRTHELDRRLVQIRTAAEISRTLSGVLDPNLLLQQVVDLVRQRFSLYYVAAFLIDDLGEYAVLRAGTGEAGSKMIAAGHRLPVGGASMIGWTIANRRPRIALDVGQDAVRFSNPLLPQTRSEMALPLVSGEQVFGALSIQSVQAEAFDEDDVAVLQGIADSLATALQNARLFQQSAQSLDEIRALNRQYVADAWKEISQQPGVSQASHENELYSGSVEGLRVLPVPLTLRDQVIGQLLLETDRTTLTPEELNFIEQVTTQAALAMENVRLLEETQRRAGEERLLVDVVQKARSSADIESILRITIKELSSALGASESEIYLAPAYALQEQPGGNGYQDGAEGGEEA